MSVSEDYAVTVDGAVVDEKAGYSTQCRAGNVRTCAELGMRCANPAHPRRDDIPRIGDSRGAGLTSKPGVNDRRQEPAPAVASDSDGTTVASPAREAAPKPNFERFERPRKPGNPGNPARSRGIASTSPKPKEKPVSTLPLDPDLYEAAASLTALRERTAEKLDRIDRALADLGVSGNGHTPPQTERAATPSRAEPLGEHKPRPAKAGGAKKSRRSWTAEQKREVVDVARREGNGAARERYGVSGSMLNAWKVQFPEGAS